MRGIVLREHAGLAAGRPSSAAARVEPATTPLAGGIQRTEGWSLLAARRRNAAARPLAGPGPASRPARASARRACLDAPARATAAAAAAAAVAPPNAAPGPRRAIQRAGRGSRRAERRRAGIVGLGARADGGDLAGAAALPHRCPRRPVLRRAGPGQDGDGHRAAADHPRVALAAAPGRSIGRAGLVRCSRWRQHGQWKEAARVCGGAGALRPLCGAAAFAMRCHRFRCCSAGAAAHMPSSRVAHVPLSRGRRGSLVPWYTLVA